MRCDDCRRQLDALHDGEMAADDDAAVRAHLVQCAECTRAYDTLTRTSQLLQDGLVHYPAPDVLKRRIHGALLLEGDARPRPRRLANRWAQLIAAGLVIAVASSAGTYATLRGGSSARSIDDEVLASHVRSLMPNHLLDVASTDQHNVKPWFNGRVDLSPLVPTLDSAGFVLTGGRLDYLAGRAVAAVVYTRRQHVINVYSWPDAGRDSPETVVTTQGYHLLRWRDAGVAYWAVSDLNVPELSEFASRYRGHDGR
jgi:anti-sigma factor RsiW